MACCCLVLHAGTAATPGMRAMAAATVATMLVAVMTHAGAQALGGCSAASTAVQAALLQYESSCWSVCPCQHNC